MTGLQDTIEELQAMLKRVIDDCVESEAEVERLRDQVHALQMGYGVDQARQENERLRAELAAAKAVEAEVQRLRDQVQVLQMGYGVDQARQENERERLRAALAEACDEFENMVDEADETTTPWRALLAAHKAE